MVFVLGLKCAIPRKYSNVCLFFCNGYVDGSALPIISNSSTTTSTDCFPPGDSTTFPFTRMDAPVETSLGVAVTKDHALSFARSCRTTICIPDMSDPSFTSINARSFCDRTDRTHPFNSKVSPTFDFPLSVPFICARRSLLLYPLLVSFDDAFASVVVAVFIDDDDDDDDDTHGVILLLLFVLLFLVMVIALRRKKCPPSPFLPFLCDGEHVVVPKVPEV